MRYCDWCETAPATSAPTPAMVRAVVGISTGSRVCRECMAVLAVTAAVRSGR